jgi:ATP-dependent phosphofructokinase / diphosphate-dependent phosphofructokinase
MKIGIVTGGGDCAGLNAVIASILKSGIRKGHTFVGFNKGLEGLLTPALWRELNIDDSRGISHLGGTILGTTNHGRFTGKANNGDNSDVDSDVIADAKRNLKILGIDGLIIIGGDGTLNSAYQLSKAGVPVIGVPKTIDNDLSATDVTFGFSTAVGIVVDALDKIHTTATSHERVFFVECMGRHTGWIALLAGLAGNANAIITPEFDVDVPALITYLRSRVQDRGMAIVVVAEGSKFAAHKLKSDRELGAEVKLAGASEKLMHAIEILAPNEFEMRNVVLGHIQRGGNPDPQDRILAKRFGIAAVEAFEEGHFGSMVRIKNGSISLAPLLEAIGHTKKVSPDSAEYKAAKAIGIYID